MSLDRIAGCRVFSLFVAWSFLAGCSGSTVGPNRAPLAKAGPDWVLRVGETALLDGSGSFDPDGDELDYQWELLVVPEGGQATLALSGSSTTELTPDVIGVWVVRLTVSDGQLDSEPDVVEVRALSPCQQDSDCDDGNSCTADRCELSKCVHPPAGDGVECGLRSCAGLNWMRNICQDGACADTEVWENCDDHGLCTTDSCDPVSGCQNAALAGGTDCGICSGCDGAGACVDDLNQDGDCPFCQECGLGAVCVNQPAGSDLRGECADLLYCNGVESCDGNGACQVGSDPCGGLTCNEVDDRCEGCTADSDCPLCQVCNVGGACVDQAVGSDLKNECAADACNTGECDGAGACGLLAAGTDCGICSGCDGAGACVDDLNQDADCPLCQECVAGGACVSQAAGSDLKNECAADACNTGGCDGAGACGLLAAGTGCGTCRACNGAGACVDDLNRDTDCPVCQECAAGGACVSQVAGNDLKNECVADACNTGVCDGADACGVLAAGTDCGICSGCDGAGACVDDLIQDADCPLCQECITGGACMDQAVGSDVKGECAAGECSTGWCNGAGSCGFAADGTPCTDLAADDCNDAQCDGTGVCDQLHAAEVIGYVCRSAAGLCDIEESCTGAGGLCPPDVVEPATVVCRSSRDPECDFAENCDGVSPGCPADNYRSNGSGCLGSDANVCNSSCQGGACQDGVDASAGEPCSDAYQCTTPPDMCNGMGGCEGVWNDAFCAALNPGDLCRPSCFGGSSGCGTPPSYLNLNCTSPIQPPNSSVCTIDLDSVGGQVGCLSCGPEVGVVALDRSDFSNAAGSCSPDGWQLVAGSGNRCSDSVAGCALSTPVNCCDTFSSICAVLGGDNVLRTVQNQNCGGGFKQWRLYKAFNTTGLGNLEVCFSLGDRDATADEGLLVYASDAGHNDQIFCLLNGPRAFINDVFYPFCAPLPAWANNNANLTITFIAHSDDPDDYLFLDDIMVKGWQQSCAPSRLTVFSESFAGCSNPIINGWNGWTVTGAPICPGGFQCSGGGNTAQAENNSWTISRNIDASGLDGEVQLCFDYGDDGSDAGESVTVEFDAGSGLQPAWYHADNLGANQTCVRVCVNLSEINRAVNRNPSLRVRFALTSNAGGDRVDLDNISLSGAVYCDGSGQVSLSDITEEMGLFYRFTATDVTGTRLDADINCSWDWPPVPVEDWSFVEFQP